MSMGNLEGVGTAPGGTGGPAIVSPPSTIWSFFRGGPHELLYPPRGTVGGLDLLRSLAILLVISGHVAGDYARYHGDFRLAKLPMFSFGWTGVDLFFILSGYLIGRQLWKELHKTGTIDVPGFMIRRSLRIWPYYFFFIALMAFVIDWPRPLGRAVPDVFFYSNYVNGIVSGGWSLSTEEQFYIFTPLLLLLTRWLRFSWKFVPLALIFAALPVIRTAVYNAWMSSGTGLPLERAIIAPFHTHADGLVFGLFLAWLSVALPAWMAPRPFWANVPVPLALMVVGAALRQVEKNAFAFTALAMVYGGIALFMLRDTGKATRWTSFRGFYLISRLSYGMYLNHFLVMPWLLYALGAGPAPGTAAATQVGQWQGFHGAQFALFYAGTVVCSVAVAFLTFCVIEHPFLVLREKWLAARAKAKGRRLAAVPDRGAANVPPEAAQEARPIG